MTESVLLDAHVQAKRMYNALTETMDLTRQLAEASDRDDQVAVQLLVSMREEPVKRLRHIQDAIVQQKEALEPQDGQRLDQLMRGEPAADAGEEPLAAQVGVNLRLWQQLRELDEVVNRKLTRGKSFYDGT